MAAALLAALFAMGVFAPAVVDAGIKGGSEKPTVELTDSRPAQEDVDATLTFTTNDEVDGDAANDVHIVITGGTMSASVTAANYAVDPDATPADNTADPTKLTVTQNGNPVGMVTISAANTITITAHPTDSSKNLKAGIPTVVKIIDLTTGAEGAYTVGFVQSAASTDTASQTASGILGISVVEASVALESTDDTMDSYDTGAPVTMELEFVTDGAAAGTNVVITLPTVYDIYDGTATALRDGVTVTVEGATGTPAYTEVTTADPPVGETITITGFQEDVDVRFTIEGVTNPTKSDEYEVTFRYGTVTEAAKASYHITDMDLVDVEEAMLDPDAAESTEAVLSFEFGSILDLGTMNDSMIVIELDDAFSLSADSEITVMQRQERNEDPVDVGGNVVVEDNTITIMKDTATDAKNIKETAPATGSRIGRNVGKVMVEITEVTNPDEAGVVEDAITVTQDMFAPGMADLTVTGATTRGTFKADTAVALELAGMMTDDGIDGGTNIQVTMPGFQIPGSIARGNVIIDGSPDGRSGSYYGNPASVEISAATSTITLRVPLRNDDGVRSDAEITAGSYRIFFLKEAGLKTPNAEGTNTITVSPDDSGLERKYDITPHISVTDPGSWVERGETVTVTAKGINAPGDATVHLLNMGNFDDVRVLDLHDATDDIEDIAELETVLMDRLMADPPTLDGEDLAVLPALDRSLRDGGTAVLDFDTSSSMFHAGAQDATGNTAATSAKGTNILVVVDAGGNVTGYTRLGLKPTVTLNLEEVRRTGRMGVTVSDWYYGTLTDLRVNGIQVGLPDPNDPDASVGWENQPPPTATPLIVVVPRRARLGTMEVVVSGTTTVKQGTMSSLDKHTQTVDVGVFNLTITPTSAVTDQVIRIEGSGFGPSQCIVSIKVGDENIRRATTGDAVAIGNVSNCVTTDTDGSLSNSFKVPHNLKPNTYPVVITDALNRVGQGEITVPKPTITLEPEASQRGSTVTVIGENFPAEDVIGVSYDADPVTVATTDTVGKWRATFKIPVDATIGKTSEVIAESEKKGTGNPRTGTGTASGQDTVLLKAMAEHTVPEEILTVSPETVSSGERLTVTASNLPLFTPVSLTIGGLGVAGRVIGEDAASDGFGRYEEVLLVPQLTVGTHNVELSVHTVGNNVTVVTFVDISEIVTRPTTDVFEDLIADGVLASVWRYRIDETGSDWDSFDPQYVGQPGINDLETVSTRDIVWIRVTENTVFQGAPLYAGWNLRTLE